MNKKYEYVFVVGCPRSGKTLLQKMLAFHGDFAWFSQYYSHFNFFPVIGALNKIYDLPTVGTFLSIFNEKIFLPHPVEMLKNYNEKLRGKGSLQEDDVTDVAKKKIKRIFEKQLQYQKKRIFLTDEGRPARMLYFQEIFPKSKFIHVIRDGRDITATLLRDRSDWFSKDLDLHSFYKFVPKDFSQSLLKYKNTDNYILALVALRWKMAISEIEKQRKGINEQNYLLVKYEDIVDNKVDTLNKVLKFLGLNWTKKLKTVIKNKNLYNENIRESYFSPKQKKILNELLKNSLIKYRYELS